MLSIFGLFAVFSPGDAAIIVAAIVGAVGVMVAAFAPFWSRIRGGQERAIGIATEAAKDAAAVAKQVYPNAGTSLRDVTDRNEKSSKRIEAAQARIEKRLDQHSEWMVRMEERLIDQGKRITTVEQRPRP